MGRCGALGLLLLASGCAVVTGLADYEIDEGVALLDGGSSTPSGDAGSSVDPGDPAADGGSPGEGSAGDAGLDAAIPNLSTCSRSGCDKGDKTTCAADACGTTRGWNESGTVQRHNALCSMSKSAFLSSALNPPARFAFEIGLTAAIVSAGGTVNLVELVPQVGDKALFAVVADGSGQVRLCRQGPVCTQPVKLDQGGPGGGGGAKGALDVYGVRDGDRWTAFLSVGSNTCPGTESLTFTSNDQVPHLAAAIGCVNSTGTCSVDVANLTFSITAY